MKTITYIYLFTLFIALCFSSCKKVEQDVYDYYPKVKTISATVTAGGEVELTGEILSSGSTDLAFIGFCMDTTANPEMLDNQLLSYTITDNLFTATYTNIDTYKPHFFRAWAVNEKGYGYGNIISLDSATANPVTVPCSPTLNTLTPGGGQPVQNFISVGLPYMGVDDWQIDASTGAGNYHFHFGSKPATRVYTVGYPPLGDYNVAMSFYSGFISGSLTLGEKVYVNQIAPDKYEISLCDAAWIYNSNTFNMTGKFSCPK